MVYATHILDNLANWPTHLVHMHMGCVKEWDQMENFDVGNATQSGNSALGEIVLKWLRNDLKARGPRPGKQGEGIVVEENVSVPR